MIRVQVLQSQQNYLKISSNSTSTNLFMFPIAVVVVDDVDIDNASPLSSFQTRTSEICEVESDVVVVVLITPPLPRDGGTAQTAVQVYAVNLIEIRLGKRWQPISNQS